MDRKEQLRSCFDGCDKSIQNIISPLIEDMVFLETELDKLRKLPHIRIHPRDNSRQEATPAAKLYKDYLSRYTDIIGRLSGILRKNELEEKDPLSTYLEKFN